MSTHADHHQFITEALPAFVSEAHEQVETVEQLLLQLEDDPGNRELLDALFRCAHTVKGSAGIFGLDQVVAFTHHVESLLDRLRDGHVSLTPQLSTLLLQCNDQIRLLIANAHELPTESDAAAQDRQALVLRLQAVGNDAVGSAAPAPAPGDPTPVTTLAMPASTGVSSTTSAADGVGGRWHLSVRFHADTFRNGMDPLAILNYLRALGHVPSLVCDTGAVPPLDQMDPESCHLGFELSLDTRATRAQIEAAFSFARDDCSLHLIEPVATEQDFAALIAAMPDNPRLGELLVSVGAITPQQLQQGLRSQTDAAAQTGHAMPLGEILQATAGLSPAVVAAALQKQQQQREGRGGPAAAPTATDDNRFIRVHADKLDAVINLMGELVIASAGGLLLARQSRQRKLTEANQQISGLVEEIRNGTLQLRMVPIGETFSRFRRVVRDTASELGKDVLLEIVGGDTELDKSVVERIADPLMHLVRNALDHGLETPEQRLAAG